ncbi:MAG TPA: hypothetical protein VFS42_00610 [Burkholderiaceae bacterium]|nr:hypothetical protein [Burkholderiaceae bacterium]
MFNNIAGLHNAFAAMPPVGAHPIGAQLSLVDHVRQQHPQWFSNHASPLTENDKQQLADLVIDVVERRFDESNVHASIAYAVSAFKEIDNVVKQIEEAQNKKVFLLRFNLRQALFKHMCNEHASHALDFFDAYKNSEYFTSKQLIAESYAHREIETLVERNLRVSAQDHRHTRITNAQLGGIGKGEFVLHVCDLFNLNQTPTQGMVNHFLSRLNEVNSSAHERVVSMIHQNPQWLEEKAEVIVHDLLENFSNDHDLCPSTGHNTHPASLFLEAVTGFVFHPAQPDTIAKKITPLINRDYPLSFIHVGDLLTRKFMEAKASNKLDDFLDRAFEPTNACYEAVTSKLSEYLPR